MIFAFHGHVFLGFASALECSSHGLTLWTSGARVCHGDEQRAAYRCAAAAPRFASSPGMSG